MKLRRSFHLACFARLIVGATTLADVSTSPASAPSTAPTTLAAPGLPSSTPTTRSAAETPLISRQMPMEFSVLISRSIFMKGRARLNSGASAWRGSADSASPEQSMVFKGATQTDNAVAALVEDTTAGKVLMLKPGDSLARGTIAAITLDRLDYSVAGHVTRVAIGQNLVGDQAAAVPSTGPTTMTSPVAPPGASTDDVLERMRRRRQQEVGR